MSISRSQSAQRAAWNSAGTAVRPVRALICPAASAQLASLRLAITTSAPAAANPDGDGPPDAPAPPGDHGDLAVQPEQAGHGARR